MSEEKAPGAGREAVKDRPEAGLLGRDEQSSSTAQGKEEGARPEAQGKEEGAKPEAQGDGGRPSLPALAASTPAPSTPAPCASRLEPCRIGVFICHCGHNIGGFVDVPAVTEYAKTLPGVVYAMHNLYTCADDGLRAIKDGIKEQKLNRVIVASCTPRTHQPLFQAACEEAGLNKYLFTFVNIREHCSWVHMKERERATDKAKDLVRMGVSRASLLIPQQETRVPVEPSSLVIGGGVAGMTAAASLAAKGFSVHLVEKETELGGMTRLLHDLFSGGGDPMAVLGTLVERVQSHPRIKIMLGSRMTALEGYVGNFQATITEEATKKETQITAGTIIVATGAIDLMPEGLYGYDVYDNVLNLTEFELLCKKKELPKLKSVAFIQCAGSRGQKVSYCSRICCTVALKGAMKVIDHYQEMTGKKVVGGKEEVVEKIHIEEKASEDIVDRRRRRRRMDTEREERPQAPAAGAEGEVEVTVFNRSITTYGVDHEIYYNKAREKRVRFVRFTPERIPSVAREGDKLAVTYWHETLKTERKLLVDMVVLSTPQIAQPDAQELSRMLKVPLGQEGFFLEAHVKLRPVDFATDGIFVCGTARGPADITESVEQALAAASRAAIPMARGYVQAEAITSDVDEAKCCGCGICAEVCPYAAIKIEHTDRGWKAQTISVACKGCGSCDASCPERAISMKHFSDRQLMVEGISAHSDLKEVVT